MATEKKPNTREKSKARLKALSKGYPKKAPAKKKSAKLKSKEERLKRIERNLGKMTQKRKENMTDKTREYGAWSRVTNPDAKPQMTSAARRKVEQISTRKQPSDEAKIKGEKKAIEDQLGVGRGNITNPPKRKIRTSR